MESVAPAGGVMVSESTARLVEHAVELGEPEWVRIKGSANEIPARRLISTPVKRHLAQRNEPTLVGRTSEIHAIAEVLDAAVSGTGCVMSIIGPPGIGKSRLVQESAALAASRGMNAAVTHCESHASDIPFHAIARLLRAGMGVNDLDDRSARARVRAQMPDADPEDLLLLDDLLGIADAAIARPMTDAGMPRPDGGSRSRFGQPQRRSHRAGLGRRELAADVIQNGMHEPVHHAFCRRIEMVRDLAGLPIHRKRQARDENAC